MRRLAFVSVCFVLAAGASGCGSSGTQVTYQRLGAVHPTLTPQVMKAYREMLSGVHCMRSRHSTARHCVRQSAVVVLAPAPDQSPVDRILAWLRGMLHR